MVSSHFFSHPEHSNPNLPPGESGENKPWFAPYQNSKNIGFCILDGELRYEFINDVLAGINGIPVAAHIGQPLRQIVPNLADQIEPSVRHVLTSGQPVPHVEIIGLRPGRTSVGRWIDHFYPIKDETGAVRKVGIMVFENLQSADSDKDIAQDAPTMGLGLERLEALFDLNALIASNWEMEQLFLRISTRLRPLLHHEYFSYALCDSEASALVYQAIEFPVGNSVTSGSQSTVEYSPCERAFHEGKTRVFSMSDVVEFAEPPKNRLLEEGLRSICCVPLLRPAGPLGVLSLGSTRENAFSTDDLKFLEAVAAELALAIDARRAVQTADFLKKKLEQERKYLEQEIQAEGLFAEIIGSSASMKRVLGQVQTVADSHATILILGETGTGKELIARAIHRTSKVKNGPFIKLNCAAIPTGLLESELFGHERGAFTGAISQKLGRMELADGGTLFLDEIGEIPLELQPKLLRVLQDQEFERLGSNRTIRVNVRLVAATNRNLEEEVARHQFRSDLFYRLNVFPIRIPPLRERREDIPALVRNFVQKFAVRMGRKIESVPSETMEALSQSPWPGNVRELENLIERSVILTQGSVLRVPLSEFRESTNKGETQASHTLDEAEREHIIRVLRETHGVISGPEGAAARLGLKRTTLHSKMQRLGINRSDYNKFLG